MKRVISIIVSLILLVVIYTKIDFAKLIAVFQNCDRMWMAISLGMVVPLTLFTSWRLQQLMPSGSRLGFFEANRLILAASVLNMVLPSKMGDIAKAYFMKQRGHLGGTLSLSLVIFEKACDMLSLLLWCVFGLLVYPDKNGLFWVMTVAVGVGLVLGILLLASKKFAYLFFLVARKIAPKKLRLKLETMQTSWGEMHDYFWRDPVQLTKITGTSIFIWFLHLLQIWFFILALKASTPFLANLALSPLAILAGLLPLTFAGVGTRDAALVLFYQPYFNAPTAAALGLLCTSRYLLPAIGGLPFLGQFMATVRGIKKE
ncbi:MAG TPA: lysylphosphatidylglycerol synthetase [Cyanobacteria bacterium UBA11149]|nr:lysylphosphatidylglycerol synthetase [Cyanobacteria bacterium UBA11367]HBE58067.1 lysylphosphatidylglycerol synthetase [Cyanobacteria bacterium UBA11366]HBK63132.1 lysylphosphatidylglycerol synthetase [Cyanobacteria bacterium UBA11166]HBR74962.1 lysylphosphatidylglycerol synthetase [Cyanobacteria bacterium UBA11159]HBS71502.1 lysylphosphatidylglycerol synthetase [Cyanobacteria bacterium UBA11153]HBW89874.1 lysylphosphatidylglycerol synthetase [Cyanobacteria bacterium UBA11149]HCA94818.1 ly